MVPTPLLAVLAVAFLVAFGFLVLSVHTYRSHDGVGVTTFSALLALMGLRLFVGLVTLAPLLFTRGPGTALGAAQSLNGATLGELVVVWVLTAFNVSVVTLIVATWVVFAVVYTVNLDASRRRLLAYVAVPIAVVFVPASVLDITVRTGAVGGDAALLALDLGRLLSRGIVLGATVLGIGLIARVALQYEYLPDRLAATLGGAMVVHVVFRAVLAEVSPALPLRLVLIVGTGLSVVTLALLAGAVFRQGLFGRLPAAGTIGPRVLFDEFGAPIVVVDFRGRVTDINPTACEVFEVERTGAVGRQFADVLPDGVDVDDLDDLPTELSVPGKDVLLSPQVSAVADQLDRVIGSGVLFRDVTDARRRRQQVGVLNRVLRHNLRNDGGTVMNYAGLLADGRGDPREHGAKIEATMGDLVEMGDTARAAETVIEAEPTLPEGRPLVDVVEDALADVDGGSGATVDVDGSLALRSTPSVLRPVLEELVENAFEHGGDDVSVRVTAESSPPGDPLAVRVDDDGPGIPDHEVEALQAGEETALTHGSGLGLWLVHWGVERLGGDLAFDAGDDGTTVSVTLPAAHRVAPGS
jgi:signal transduction histidine kinase